MALPDSSPAAPRFTPAAPVDRLVRPLERFLQVEAVGGLVLLAYTAIALVLANSRWAAGFAALWQTPASLAVGGFALAKPLLLVVNDGLMTLFFFVVGLEIKRELVTGELRDPRKAALPVMAALGGMVVPAAIYLALRGGRAGAAGWGVPMATDIAFAVGILSLLGRRVPVGLKILLLSLAIVDDIGAILVIAVFYSEGIDARMLGLAGAGLGLIVGLRLLGVRRVAVYVLVGVAVWLFTLKSHVHPTIAGVALGLLTPASRRLGRHDLLDAVEGAMANLRDEPGRLTQHEHNRLLLDLGTAAREAVSPLERLEAALHPWVALAIMPLFALANAGVAADPAALGHPVAIAVALGLALGKPLGIVGFSWVAVKLRIASLPAGVTWKAMVGLGCLGGIGFTMSLFIAGLALPADLLDAGKIGTLLGSTVSAILGLALLIAFLPRRPEE